MRGNTITERVASYNTKIKKQTITERVREMLSHEINDMHKELILISLKHPKVNNLVLRYLYFCVPVSS